MLVINIIIFVIIMLYLFPPTILQVLFQEIVWVSCWLYIMSTFLRPTKGEPINVHVMKVFLAGCCLYHL